MNEQQNKISDALETIAVLLQKTTYKDDTIVFKRLSGVGKTLGAIKMIIKYINIQINSDPDILFCCALFFQNLSFSTYSYVVTIPKNDQNI